MADDTVPPTAPAPASAAVSPLVSLFDLQPVNSQAVDELRTKYGNELKATQGALSQKTATREDITSRNLRAIDEAISGLKNSRYSGPIGLDPAVSAAMAAGFLKTTPGVAGNFMSELGNAMGNAAPIIASNQKSDRDSFAMLAELQRKRGEYESQPTKEEQDELRARERELMGNIKEVDKAGLRAPITAQHDAQKIDAKNEALLVKAITDAQNNARKDAESATAGAEFLTPEQRDLLRRFYLQKRIDAYNSNRPPNTPEAKNPEAFDPNIDGPAAEKLRTTIEAKGADTERTKALKSLHDEVSNRVPKNYNPEVWRALSPEQQQALIDESLAKEVARYNSGLPDDPKKHLPPVTVNQDLVRDAKLAADQTRNIGTPSKEQLEKANLPAYDTPNAYAGVTYEQRIKAIDEAQRNFNESIKSERDQAMTLGKRREQANRLWSLYNQTDRTGNLGNVTAMGSAAAQAFDKDIADLQLNNFPKGQGAISEGERAIMAKSVAARALQPEALKIVLDTYVMAGQRANEEVSFKEAWFRAHKTLQGSTEAWNRYINSPEGVFMMEDKAGKIMRNDNRQTWQEFFRGENKGGGPLAVGDVRDGYRYMGGRRGDPNSWKKVE